MGVLGKSGYLPWLRTPCRLPAILSAQGLGRLRAGSWFGKTAASGQCLWFASVSSIKWLWFCYCTETPPTEGFQSGYRKPSYLRVSGTRFSVTSKAFQRVPCSSVSLCNPGFDEGGTPNSPFPPPVSQGRAGHHRVSNAEGGCARQALPATFWCCPPGE